MTSASPQGTWLGRRNQAVLASIRRKCINVRSNAEWKKWGKLDPLWAAVTWDGRQRSSRQPWTDEEFYALGEAQWANCARHWRDYGLTCGHCLEIGCGPGRMTLQLGRAFEQVTAVDVSDDQIDYAKARAEGLPVRFLLTDGVTIPLADATVDAAFSTHVFQHFDSRADALEVWREIYRLLRPGGTVMIHVPLFQIPEAKGSGLIRAVMCGLDQAKLLKAAALRRTGRLLMRMLWYEKSWLVHELGRLGFTRVEFRTFDHGGKAGFHDFVFATKPTA